MRHAKYGNFVLTPWQPKSRNNGNIGSSVLNNLCIMVVVVTIPYGSVSQPF
jgi:hypothetical protein